METNASLVNVIYSSHPQRQASRGVSESLARLSCVAVSLESTISQIFQEFAISKFM